MRTESRCSHYRLDYPDVDDENWRGWTNIYKDDQGNMQLEKQAFDAWPSQACLWIPVNPLSMAMATINRLRTTPDAQKRATSALRPFGYPTICTRGQVGLVDPSSWCVGTLDACNSH